MAVHKFPTAIVTDVVQRAQRWLDRRPAVQRWLKILRLGLFQFGMGLSLAPLTGTLNRVLIDELHIPAVAVGLLIALHYFVSPARALIGYRSDQERAVGHWRTPYLVLGALLTYGGLATVPFSLILLSGEGTLVFPIAFFICLLIFLAYGIGVNIVETIYLAVVSDITPPKERGQVLAVLWIMLVLGTVVSSVVMGQLLLSYSHYRLIQVMQGSAVVFIALTFVALYNQERLKPNGLVDTELEAVRVRQSLGASIRTLWNERLLRNLIGLLTLATLAFATHDVLLEPYGGQVLAMSITQTTQLTALWGSAMLVAIACSGWLLWRGRSSVLLITLGCLAGCAGFLLVTLAGSPALVNLFRVGVSLIGLGRGMFIVGSLALIMSLVDVNHTGLFLGMWGMLQALGQGFGTIGGGLIRDLAQLTTGSVALGYTTVYTLSLGVLTLTLLLIALMRLGRLVRAGAVRSPWAGLQDVPADQIAF